MFPLVVQFLRRIGKKKEKTLKMHSVVTMKSQLLTSLKVDMSNPHG